MLHLSQICSVGKVWTPLGKESLISSRGFRKCVMVISEHFKREYHGLETWRPWVVFNLLIITVSKFCELRKQFTLQSVFLLSVFHIILHLIHFKGFISWRSSLMGNIFLSFISLQWYIFLLILYQITYSN